MLMGRDLGIAAHQAHSRVRWAYDAKQVFSVRRAPGLILALQTPF